MATVNDVRAGRGLLPVPWGDVPWLPGVPDAGVPLPWFNRGRLPASCVVKAAYDEEARRAGGQPPDAAGPGVE
jgi:hypothetical protein